MNRCWFSTRIVAVKIKYGLTVAVREAAAPESVLSACRSTAMEFAAKRFEREPAEPAAQPPAEAVDTGIPWQVELLATARTPDGSRLALARATGSVPPFLPETGEVLGRSGRDVGAIADIAMVLKRRRTDSESGAEFLIFGDP